jgi:hypothetical protein
MPERFKELIYCPIGPPLGEAITVELRRRRGGGMLKSSWRAGGGFLR